MPQPGAPSNVIVSWKQSSARSNKDTSRHEVHEVEAWIEKGADMKEMGARGYSSIYLLANELATLSSHKHLYSAGRVFNLPRPVIRCHQAWPSSSTAQGRPTACLSCRTWEQKTLSRFQIKNPPRKTLSPVPKWSAVHLELAQVIDSTNR